MGGNEAVIENAELLQKGMLEYVQYLEEALNTAPVGMLLSTVKVVVYDLSNSFVRTSQGTGRCQTVLIRTPDSCLRLLRALAPKIGQVEEVSSGECQVH